MSRLQRLFRPAQRFARRLLGFDVRAWSDFTNAPEWLIAPSGAASSNSGQTVTEDSALRLSAVFACVRILQQTISTIPLQVYERTGGGGRGKRIVSDHPLYDVLHRLTFPDWNLSSLEFRELMMGWLALYGNAYALIQRDGRGRVTGLQPWHPTYMVVHKQAGGVKYMLQAAGGEVELDQREVLHIRAMLVNADCVVGLSPIQYARETLGTSQALEQFGGKFFANAARPSGVLEVPFSFDGREDAMRRLRDSWENLHKSSANVGKTAILEEGTTFKPLTIPPGDAQFLESRRFGIEEIARIFWCIPPHMIGDMTHATYSNIEQQGIEFVTKVARPLAVKFETALNNTLFSKEDRKRYFAEFNLDGLMRGDTESRYRAYSSGMNWGFLSPNDIRDLENMNRVEGGDQYFVPLNMVPIKQSEALVKAQIEKPAASAPAKEDDEEAQPKQSQEGKAGPHRRETRATGAAFRLRLREGYRPLVRNAAERIVRAEVRGIRKQIDSARALRDKSIFDNWLEQFYNSEFGPVIEAAMGAVFASLAESVGGAAADEIASQAPDMSVFTTDYLRTFILKHQQGSIGQLQALEDFDAVEERLDEWLEKRPEKIGDEEATKLSDAAAKVAFVAGGVTLLKWQANANACPLCRSLDQQVVGVDRWFVPAGGTVDPQDGETAPMHSYGNVGHAPLHQGCQCTVVPG